MTFISNYNSERADWKVRLFCVGQQIKKQGCLEHCILKSYTFATLCKAEEHFL